MRRYFITLLLVSVFQALLSWNLALAQDEDDDDAAFDGILFSNVVTYANENRARLEVEGQVTVGDPNPTKLWDVLTRFGNNGIVWLNDDLDMTYYGNAPNGVIYDRGIPISGTWLFINNVAVNSVDNRRYVSSTPLNRYPLYNITGHLRIEEYAYGVNSVHVVQNGRREFTRDAVNNYSGGGGIRVGGYVTTTDNTTTATYGSLNVGTRIRFDSNTTDWHGGGLYAAYQNQTTADNTKLGIITFEKDVSFYANKAEGSGGGIYATDYGYIYIFSRDSYTQFRNDGYGVNNYSGYTHGGFDHIQNTQYGLSMSSNSAVNHGGGIAAVSDAIIWNDSTSTFSNNIASGGYGGGIYATDTATVNLYGGLTMQGNAAYAGGGGIAVLEEAVVQIGGALSIKDNYATGTQNVTMRNGTSLVGGGDAAIPLYLYPGKSAWDSERIEFSSIPRSAPAGYGGFAYLRGEDSDAVASLLLGDLPYTEMFGATTTTSTSQFKGVYGTISGNYHGNENTTGTAANAFYQAENSFLRIIAARGGTLAIYDPFASSGLEYTGGEWVLENKIEISDEGFVSGIEAVRNNVIQIGFDTDYNGNAGNTSNTGRVQIWGDSSDSAFLATNPNMTERELDFTDRMFTLTRFNNRSGVWNGYYQFYATDDDGNYIYVNGQKVLQDTPVYVDMLTTYVDDGTAYGTYANVNIYSGTFELMNGMTIDSGPTEFGSNRYFDEASSGTMTIGNGMQTDGSGTTNLATSVNDLATVVLWKYTDGLDADDPDHQYTTLRAMSITMDGGVLKFVGENTDGTISETSGDDTAKVYLRPNNFWLFRSDVEKPGLYTHTDQEITLEGGLDPINGTGHGGTFYIDTQQEYSLYFKISGTGNLTKAGSGLLTIVAETWASGDGYEDEAGHVYRTWLPSNDASTVAFLDDVVHQTVAKTHMGLTVVSGGTLDLGVSNNVLGHMKLFGDGPRQIAGNVGWAIKKDYNDRLIFEGISRGVVLTGDTGGDDGTAIAVLDMSKTGYTVVSSDLVSVREQSISALAGVDGTRLILNTTVETGKYRDPTIPDDLPDFNSEVVLTVSDGWGADLDGLELAGYLEENFANTEFEGGANYNRYFSGTIVGGGKLIKRGAGALGLAGVNDLTQSVELQGGALYFGNELAIGVYDEGNSDYPGIGLIEVFGADQATYASSGMSQVGDRATGSMSDKIIGIRGDADYTLQVRIVADADDIPVDPTSQTGYEEWNDRPTGNLTIDANNRILTFANLSTRNDGVDGGNGAVINMKSPTLNNAWEFGADLYFEARETSGYVFRDNTAGGKGGAIYAGGSLYLCGNTLFANNTSSILVDNKVHTYGAIYVAGSNDRLNKSVVELNTATGDIAFAASNNISMTFVDNTDINILGAYNIYFDSPIKVDELAAPPSDLHIDVSLDTNKAFVQFCGTSPYTGSVAVNSGTFRLAPGAEFGETTEFVVVRDMAGDEEKEGVLAGSGVLKSNSIDLQGRVAPDSFRYAIPTNLISQTYPEYDVKNLLNRGVLTLESENISLTGTYAVDLTYDRSSNETNNGHLSDRLVVKGNLQIGSTATLEINPRMMNFAKAYREGVTYYIIESDTSIEGNAYSDNRIDKGELPRLLELLEHGFTSGKMGYYLSFGASGWTFLDAAGTRNQRAVASIFNTMFTELDHLDGKFNELVYRASLMDDDADIRHMLNEFSPDVRANSLTLGFSEPWRPVFERMQHRDPGYRRPVAHQVQYRGQYRVPFKTRPREIWFQGYYRSMDTYGDDNARDYGTSRTGFVLGIEKEIHDDIRVGGIFGFAAPYLFQKNGKVDANDFQGGLYLLMNLPYHVEFRGYIGMSGLNYDYARNENPFTDKTLALDHNSRYQANFNGQTLAFSAELSRPLRWSSYWVFLPVAGIDHQVSKQDAFTEKGGVYNQAFDSAEFSQTTVRFGLNSQIGESEAFQLKTRLQYGIRLQDTAPTSRSCFVDLADSPVMTIDGIVLGSNYVNLGIGTEFYLNPRGTSRMFFNYDADITERSIVNTGAAGMSLQW